ncbi:hypothetical protein K440DRAFT_249289 [Wilcoxina mikolae CBS 423.85]|nr:hypothetical protein K440DRAFT_249289 [Wilcoxina mikolae CBS 423.85]
MTAEVGVKMASTTETQPLTLEVVGDTDENVPTESNQSIIPVLPTTSDSSDSKDNAPSESSQLVTPVLLTTSGISPDGEDKKEITTSLDHNAKTADEGGKKGKPVEKEKEPKRYDGNHPEMKYMTRKLLAMNTSDFGEAGEKLLLRTHILDLRCPESEKTVELEEPNMPEAKFDAIRINSCWVLKWLIKAVGSNLPFETFKINIPLVFWKPFPFLVENVECLEGYLEELVAQRSQVALENSTSEKESSFGSVSIINGIIYDQC